MQGSQLPLATNGTLLPVDASRRRMYPGTQEGVSRLMIKTGSPKKLWDHCIILMVMISSCSTNRIFMTTGQVPETIMTGETAGISQICQFGWYDWVMYHDPAKFPDDKAIL